MKRGSDESPPSRPKNKRIKGVSGGVGIGDQNFKGEQENLPNSIVINKGGRKQNSGKKGPKGPGATKAKRAW